MTRRPDDMTQPLDLRHEHRTSGPVRVQTPKYLDQLPPCNQACPAGEDIQGWLSKAMTGDFRAAWEHLIINNPLPAVHGRVCYHPCESSCNRVYLDDAVSIHAVERFLGDLANEQGWPAPPPAASTGFKVLVVGAGPSGLSAAYHLARLGHAVEVREAGPVAGGMMHFGIPAYRLPRADLEADIQRIANMGVRFVFNHKVQDLLAEKAEGGFDAVFIAIGAHIGKKIDIPARDAGKMLDAVSFLHAVDQGETPKLGRRVAIYGGGNTAMDAARVARRLGAEEALIIYRRDREHMPAHSFEADEALEEGVKIHWLRSIKGIENSTVSVEVMRINDQGRPEPTGEIESLEADSLIMALGQNTDSDFLREVPDIQFKSDGTVVVDQGMMTGAAGIFAGGDMVPSERTVTVAVGHGKKASRHIDAWLRGERHQPAPKHPVVNFDQLHLWYFSEADQQTQSHVEQRLRERGFAEVVQGFDQSAALFEAKRCLSCGNCFECDGCYGACPEDAVIKLGPGKRYQFDYTLCTGCAVCFEQCPCHAIDMSPEPVT